MDWKLTPDNDLDLTGANVNVITGREAHAQHLKIRMETWQGEWTFDLRRGLPYIQRILILNFNEADVRTILYNYILATPGFIAINQMDFDFDPTEAKLSLTCRAQTIAGEINFSAEVTTP